MKLESIKSEHVIEAGRLIDHYGIEASYISNNYWVQLPNGKEYPFKHLTRIAYELSSNDEEQQVLKFQSNNSYRNYLKDLGFQINYYAQNLNFIKGDEIEFYQRIAGCTYRKDNPEDVRKGNLLRPLVYKLNKWVKESLVEDFEVKEDYHWQWSGTFKKYLWLRVYRKSDSKKVYFVFGCNGAGNLYMSLNCQRSNYASGSTKALSSGEVTAFDQYLSSSNYSEKFIGLDQLADYNWERLISEAQAYLSDYASLYDELESIVSSDFAQIESPSKNELIEDAIPESTKSYANRSRSFVGRNINWGRKHKESEALGFSGEQLVLNYEKKRLRTLNREDLSEKVRKVKDGSGFDILSYDEFDNEVHIEVKTTLGNKEEPFYMSLNEQCYFQNFPYNYVVYRLYNFDALRKSARFYKISAEELSEFTFKATNFEISK